MSKHPDTAAVCEKLEVRLGSTKLTKVCLTAEQTKRHGCDKSILGTISDGCVFVKGQMFILSFRSLL